MLHRRVSGSADSLSVVSFLVCCCRSPRLILERFLLRPTNPSLSSVYSSHYSKFRLSSLNLKLKSYKEEVPDSLTISVRTPLHNTNTCQTLPARAWLGVFATVHMPVSAQATRTRATAPLNLSLHPPQCGFCPAPFLLFSGTGTLVAEQQERFSQEFALRSPVVDGKFLI